VTTMTVTKLATLEKKKEKRTWAPFLLRNDNMNSFMDK
jgi:hypothetical protein